MFKEPVFKTLKLNKQGDISFDNLGHLSWVVNEQSIAQTVNIRLMTRLGDLFYDEQFGLYRVHIKNTIKNTMTLSSEIRDALVDEDKIIDAEIVDVIIYNNNIVDVNGNFLNGSAILKIAVTLFDRSVLDIDFPVGGELSGI